MIIPEIVGWKLKKIAVATAMVVMVGFASY